MEILSKLLGKKTKYVTIEVDEKFGSLWVSEADDNGYWQEVGGFHKNKSVWELVDQLRSSYESQGTVVFVEVVNHENA